jgi:hypothetical protein
MTISETENDRAFWSPAAELPDAPDVRPDTPSALERLGPSPFPKSGFPFLGFLATVYDHVATHVGGASAESPGPINS